MSKRKSKKHRYALSRKQKHLLTGLFICVLFAITLADRSGCAAFRKDLTEYANSQPEQRKYHSKAFKITNIVDGDTLDIDISDGDSTHTRIRLLGIDTPETGSGRYSAMYFGAEATAYAKNLALNKEAVIILDPAANIRDKYNRLLAFIKLPDGQILNEILVRDGYAYADLRFSNSELTKYVQLQEEAMQQKKGLWQNVERSDLPGWLQRERPDLLSN